MNPQLYGYEVYKAWVLLELTWVGYPFYHQNDNKESSNG